MRFDVSSMAATLAVVAAGAGARELSVGDDRGSNGAPPSARVASENSVAERCRSIVSRFAEDGFTGAVLVARDGAIVAEMAVGHADLEGTVPNTPETLFEIASLTKQFTAAAVLKLVEEGKLRLDDPISKHLPGVPENCRAITIEHLLRHTSGIPGTNSHGHGDDIDVVLPTFLQGGPRHEPGTHWEYWNQGYAIVTEIIARAAGRPYVDYCKEMLFRPAGMTTACFTGDAAPEGAVVATGRSRMGPPRSALEHPYGAYGFQYRGMGGAVCSVRDLWKWDRALRGDGVLNEGSRKELFTQGIGSYALGWMISTDPQGRVVERHGGGVRGFVCDMRRYPDLDGTVIVLANDDRARLLDLVSALERALRDEPPGPEESLKPLPPELADALVGTYRSGRGTLLTVKRQGRATSAMLHFMPPDGPRRDSRLLVDDKGAIMISYPGAVHEVTLERDDAGAVTAMTMFQFKERFERTAQASDRAPRGR